MNKNLKGGRTCVQVAATGSCKAFHLCSPQVTQALSQSIVCGLRQRHTGSNLRDFVMEIIVRIIYH